MDGQISLFEWIHDKELAYKIEAVYLKVFDVKKFRNYIRDRKLHEIIDYLRFQGKHCAGYGWSRKNSTIINITDRGVVFNYESTTYSYKQIAELLVEKYAKM